MPPKVFADDLQLKPWDAETCAPCVGLINPKSGGKMGEPILEVCQRTDYYKDRIFHIIQVVKGGDDFTNFRKQLCEAKNAAAAKNDPAFRPRLIVGGGDGTASFGLMIVFKALLADAAAGEGYGDKGNGFHWTDEELEKYFPALVQMPLGTGNDLGGVLGWGRKHPGHAAMGGVQAHGSNLQKWFEAAVARSSPMVNFDVWGFMPPPGEEVMNVKLCELAKMEKIQGREHCVMKPADVVVPFLVLLYSSFGFSGQVISEFQLVRHDSQAENFREYVKLIPSLLFSSEPPELRSGMEGFSIENGPGEAPNPRDGSNRYFPPRQTRKAKSYGEVGFLNINSYGGGSLQAADRASFSRRWCMCGAGREVASPSDGMMDFFRTRYARTNLKTGSLMQVDKKRNVTFKFEPAKGKGVFMQYDGEGRYVFSPDGSEWRMDVHQVLRVPFVLGPGATVKRTVEPISFQIVGEGEEKKRIARRIVRWVHGDLVKELNATAEDIRQAGLPIVEEGKAV
mmetsp:Transcript_71056/g.170223  ORF Transcript_71056/g.170223 Transcript_71056/m.170223 type:complete len:509 (-) Transcript_71056:65-1591(-)